MRPTNLTPENLGLKEKKQDVPLRLVRILRMQKMIRLKKMSLSSLTKELESSKRSIKRHRRTYHGRRERS